MGPPFPHPHAQAWARAGSSITRPYILPAAAASPPVSLPVLDRLGLPQPEQDGRYRCRTIPPSGYSLRSSSVPDQIAAYRPINAVCEMWIRSVRIVPGFLTLDGTNRVAHLPPSLRDVSRSAARLEPPRSLRGHMCPRSTRQPSPTHQHSTKRIARSNPFARSQTAASSGGRR